mmetsp:Transcript_21873/g.36214  ORF Transcript_21873/g.36214 Transcript_21873/m.36214 type:complete len:780 (-) Transcript_21873:605-2944(-)
MTLSGDDEEVVVKIDEEEDAVVYSDVEMSTAPSTTNEFLPLLMLSAESSLAKDSIVNDSLSSNGVGQQTKIEAESDAASILADLSRRVLEERSQRATNDCTSEMTNGDGDAFDEEDDALRLALALMQPRRGMAYQEEEEEYDDGTAPDDQSSSPSTKSLRRSQRSKPSNQSKRRIATALTSRTADKSLRPRLHPTTPSERCDNCSYTTASGAEPFPLTVCPRCHAPRRAPRPLWQDGEPQQARKRPRAGNDAEDDHREQEEEEGDSSPATGVPEWCSTSATTSSDGDTPASPHTNNDVDSKSFVQVSRRGGKVSRRGDEQSFGMPVDQSNGSSPSTSPAPIPVVYLSRSERVRDRPQRYKDEQLSPTSTPSGPAAADRPKRSRRPHARVAVVAGMGVSDKISGDAQQVPSETDSTDSKRSTPKRRQSRKEALVGHLQITPPDTDSASIPRLSPSPTDTCGSASTPSSAAAFENTKGNTSRGKDTSSNAAGCATAGSVGANGNVRRRGRGAGAEWVNERLGADIKEVDALLGAVLVHGEDAKWDDIAADVKHSSSRDPAALKTLWADLKVIAAQYSPTSGVVGQDVDDQVLVLLARVRSISEGQAQVKPWVKALLQRQQQAPLPSPTSVHAYVPANPMSPLAPRPALTTIAGSPVPGFSRVQVTVRPRKAPEALMQAQQQQQKMMVRPVMTVLTPTSSSVSTATLSTSPAPPTPTTPTPASVKPMVVSCQPPKVYITDTTNKESHAVTNGVVVMPPRANVTPASSPFIVHPSPAPISLSS